MRAGDHATGLSDTLSRTINLQHSDLKTASHNLYSTRQDRTGGSTTQSVCREYLLILDEFWMQSPRHDFRILNLIREIGGQMASNDRMTSQPPIPPMIVARRSPLPSQVNTRYAARPTAISNFLAIALRDFQSGSMLNGG